MKLLVCVDGSSQSSKAVVKAVEIASGCQVHSVSLIGVRQKNFSPVMSEGSNAKTILEELEKSKGLVEQEFKYYEKHLNHAAMRFREKGIEAEILMKEGHPAEIITKTAAEGDFDMIIMGSRGQGNLSHLLLGSVSNAVIHQTKSSVLIVK